MSPSRNFAGGSTVGLSVGGTYSTLTMVLTMTVTPGMPAADNMGNLGTAK